MDAKLNERFKGTYNLRVTAHAQTRCVSWTLSVPVSSTGSDRKHYSQLFLWLPRGHRIVYRTCQQNGKFFIKLFWFSFYPSANSPICTEFRFVLRAGSLLRNQSVKRTYMYPHECVCRQETTFSLARISCRSRPSCQETLTDQTNTVYATTQSRYFPKCQQKSFEFDKVFFKVSWPRTNNANRRQYRLN